MKKQRRSFSTEFKHEAACLVLDQGYAVLEACRSLDIGETALRRWVQQMELERGGGTPVSKALTAEQRRIQELEARVHRLEREKADQYPSRLSGSQQQRVAIARALAMQPDIMLFDEVTSSLDPELVGEVLKSIQSLSKGGMTMIVVTHELGFAYHVVKQVLFLHDGVIHEQGTPDEVLKHPREERTRAFLTGFTDFNF